MAHLRIGDKQLEYLWHGPGPGEALTLVFLHEGLGSVSAWKSFPEQLAEVTSCGALVYSRFGYGESDRAELPRPVRFMHDEALNVLPKVLDALKIRNAILIGHSDGGSISIIYAGAHEDGRISAVILEAPHVFVEAHGLNSIEKIANEYRAGHLRARLKRYHDENVDDAFWGWNDIWMNAEFQSWNIEEYLPRIRVPVLVIQGEDDQYGTMDQVKAIVEGCNVPVRTCVLPNSGHHPHLEQPDLTLKVMAAFIRSLDQ